jgi:hypothetical protein
VLRTERRRNRMKVKTNIKAGEMEIPEKKQKNPG